MQRVLAVHLGHRYHAQRLSQSSRFKTSQNTRNPHAGFLQKLLLGERARLALLTTVLMLWLCEVVSPAGPLDWECVETCQNLGCWWDLLQQCSLFQGMLSGPMFQSENLLDSGHCLHCSLKGWHVGG